MKRFKKYLPSLVFIGLVAGIGAFFTYSGMEWFDALIKPKEWLPNIVIPIIWTIIYLLFYIYTIKVAYYEDNELTNLLIINGMLNLFWCFIYFGVNSLLGGLIVIILNLVLSVVLITKISKQNKTFGYVLMIYPIWLSIATMLNLACWILN